MVLHINATKFGIFIEDLISLNVILEYSFSRACINVISYQLDLLIGLEEANSLFTSEGSLPTLEVCELCSSFDCSPFRASYSSFSFTEFDP
jgi:hypothetical protein